MTQLSPGLKILFLILIINSLINCQNNNNNENSNTVSNSRMTKVIERHSENIRQWLCRKGQQITPEQWANLKSECINPRAEELMPENAINAWEQCNEKVADLCDDTQWMNGKDCAKDMLKDEDAGEIQVWYRSRVRQMTNNFQVIKNCYLQQRKSA